MLQETDKQTIERLSTEVAELKAGIAQTDKYVEALEAGNGKRRAEIERLTAEGGRLRDIAFEFGYRARMHPDDINKAIDEYIATASGRQEFYVEQAKGFWWVTERATNHNYAQTDSKERAKQICRDLNAGIREFEEDGYPADSKQETDNG